LRTGELLEFTVHLFDLLAPSVLVLNLGGGERTLGIVIMGLIEPIGNHPVNVAVQV
jgi:hypothetical protein